MFEGTVQIELYKDGGFFMLLYPNHSCIFGSNYIVYDLGSIATGTDSTAFQIKITKNNSSSEFSVISDEFSIFHSILNGLEMTGDNPHYITVYNDIIFLTDFKGSVEMSYFNNDHNFSFGNVNCIAGNNTFSAILTNGTPSGFYSLIATDTDNELLTFTSQDTFEVKNPVGVTIPVNITTDSAIIVLSPKYMTCNVNIFLCDLSSTIITTILTDYLLEVTDDLYHWNIPLDITDGDYKIKCVNISNNNEVSFSDNFNLTRV